MFIFRLWCGTLILWLELHGWFSSGPPQFSVEPGYEKWGGTSLLCGGLLTHCNELACLMGRGNHLMSKKKKKPNKKTTSSVLIKLVLKWIWDTKSATRNPIYNNLRLLSGKLGQPSEAHFHFTILTSNSISTYSLLQSLMQLCLSLINSVAVLMLTSTQDPLERHPDRQVVITSGFQLHLPCAPLSLGLMLWTTERPSLKPQCDITNPLSHSKAADIYYIALVI